MGHITHILEIYWGYAKIMPGICRVNAGDMLAICWRRANDMLGIRQGYTRDMQGIFVLICWGYDTDMTKI